MSFTKLLNIGSRALTTYQQALGVTSNNISNAGNANYSRQRAVLSPDLADRNANYSLGSGVILKDVQRVKNMLTDSQIRTYNNQYNYNSKQSTYLQQIESSLSEPGDQGLNSLMNQFFNSWTDASVNPESVSLRQNVVQKTQLMASKFQNIYEGIASLKPDLRSDAESMTKTINAQIKQINTLNKQIYEASMSGGTPNDLLDQRDEVVQAMSQIANISATIDKDNMAVITIGGMLAADRFVAEELKVAVDGNALKIQTADGAATLAVNGGELGAVTQLYSSTIPDMLKKLDTMAGTLIEKVNSLHSKGHSLGTPPETGIDFFSGYQNGVIKINSKILENAKNLALSSDGSTGNNSIAVQIAELKNAKNTDGQTMPEMYADFVNTLASSIENAEQTADSSSMVLSQLQSQKESYSGVSVDEEMVNILKYQRSYDAAAKLIKTANDMFQTLLNVV
ncbi:MAG: flagellar hook-associated protein FlgK [Ignavibacteriales bacterium]|nr:flagellar hook-associated protein FlgK [Ignavibacteriales bacterium]